MKFNVATIVWLLVGVASLVAAWFQGAIQSHPDVVAGLVGLHQLLGTLLGPLVQRQPPPGGTP